MLEGFTHGLVNSLLIFNYYLKCLTLYLASYYPNFNFACHLSSNILAEYQQG